MRRARTGLRASGPQPVPRFYEGPGRSRAAKARPWSYPPAKLSLSCLSDTRMPATTNVTTTPDQVPRTSMIIGKVCAAHCHFQRTLISQRNDQINLLIPHRGSHSRRTPEMGCLLYTHVTVLKLGAPPEPFRTGDGWRHHLTERVASRCALKRPAASGRPIKGSCTLSPAGQLTARGGESTVAPRPELEML